MKLKDLLTEAESFTATNKKTGKTSVFKSKDSRDTAVKAGTHTAIKDPKAGGKASKGGVNIFDNPAAGAKKGKDDKSKAPAMKHTKVGEDSLEVKTISQFTNLRAKALSDFINKNKLDATAIANFVKKGSLKDRMDIGTALVGNPGNSYEKKVIKKFGANEEQPKAEPKAKVAADMGVDKVVYNTRTKTVGIVRMGDERGETKTDADGNVNTSELEPYNPMKYPHQKDAKVAPSTKKEVDSRGLWNPFAPTGGDDKKETPKSKPTPKINSKNWKPDEDGSMSNEASDDVQNYLNDVLGVDGLAEVDYNTGNIQYGLSDGENSIFVGNEGGTYNVSFEGPSMDIDKINQSYKSFKNPKEALQYAGELAKANKNGLEQKQDMGGESKPEPQTEPTSKPKEARKGNPQVNKDAKAQAEKFGITPQKLGNDGYKKAMYQAAVEALTDANFHTEARELIASIEGKPEWAKKVEYPSMDDPKFKEKMADIRTNGVDSSEYWGSEGNAHELGRKIASSAGWGGVEAADGIAFTLRMNGFHKEADRIQSVFDNKPYMRNESMSLVKMLKK